MSRIRTYAPTEDVKATLNRFSSIMRGLKDDINSLVDFSLREVNTGQTWLKGQTIFRRGFNIAPLPNATTKVVEHDVDYTRIVRIEGFARDGDVILPLPYASGTAANVIEVSVDRDGVSITTGVDRTSYAEAYIFLEYIK